MAVKNVTVGDDLQWLVYPLENITLTSAGATDTDTTSPDPSHPPPETDTSTNAPKKRRSLHDYIHHKVSKVLDGEKEKHLV